jgi:hypothetical protein
MLINPNIDTFISKFSLTEDNQSSYISILSMVNPLGGLFGVFIAKALVNSSDLLITLNEIRLKRED